ncbi:hypothetical protein SCT_3046 [Sulfuricella sp. T08]|nr:hypothetical protein SCT_3046 [Sulfuricella sp. T08]
MLIVVSIETIMRMLGNELKRDAVASHALINSTIVESGERIVRDIQRNASHPLTPFNVASAVATFVTVGCTTGGNKIADA